MITWDLVRMLRKEFHPQCWLEIYLSTLIINLNGLFGEWMLDSIDNLFRHTTRNPIEDEITIIYEGFLVDEPPPRDLSSWM